MTNVVYKEGELEAMFDKEVRSKGQIIDPENELDWFGLVVGWAIAKGLKVSDARDFASAIDY
jgi:hypothetical protein